MKKLVLCAFFVIFFVSPGVALEGQKTDSRWAYEYILARPTIEQDGLKGIEDKLEGAPFGFRVFANTFYPQSLIFVLPMILAIHNEDGSIQPVHCISKISDEGLDGSVNWVRVACFGDITNDEQAVLTESVREGADHVLMRMIAVLKRHHVPL